MCQFSLRALVLFVALIAILLGMIIALPQALSLFLYQIITISASAIFIVVALYGKRSTQAFAIGAAVPQLFMCLTYSALGYADILSRWSTYNSMDVNRWFFFIPWIHSFVLGGVCVAVAQYLRFGPER